MKKIVAALSVLLLALSMVLSLPTQAASALGNASSHQLKIAPLKAIKKDGGIVGSPESSTHSSNKASLPRSSLPASFRLPAASLTAVRDQGQYGTCWAFASIGSAESIAKAEGVSSNPDFSEWQLAYFTFTNQNGRPAFDLTQSSSPYDNGGNDQRAVAMFARGTSPVLESQAPYAGATPSPAVQPSFDLKNWYIAHTSDEWKSLLMTKGALYISYYHNDTYYSAATHSYYDPNPIGSTNHAVTLVGWDDNYPASKFINAPPGNGAWIIKNSWGTGWGESGYFYMSYYSQDLNARATGFELQAIPANEKEYTYDDLGWVSEAGFSSDVGTIMGTYTASGQETLKSVGTYAVGDSTSFSLNIATKNASTGNFDKAWTTPQTGTIASSGYARIDLKSPVSLAPGQQYEVIITLTVPGTIYPMPLEESYTNYSSQAKIDPGQTFFSNDGGVTWYDGYLFSAEACIYAFTVTVPKDVTPPAITLKNAASAVLANGAFANTNVVVTVTDASPVTKTAVRNGTSLAWPANSTFTLEGDYTLTARDSAGNASQALFHIDKTKPAVAGTANSASVANGSFVKYSVSVSATDAHLLLKTAALNSAVIAWPAANAFASDGAYLVMAVDAAGNLTSLTFTVDKTAPAVALRSPANAVIASGAFSKTEVAAIVTDANLLSETATLNGAALAWPASNIFTADGKYSITAKDRAGNVTTATFQIDRTLPLITVKSASGAAVPNNGSVKAKAGVAVSDANLLSKTITKNGVAIAWPATNALTSVGKYVVTATDRAGNVSTYTFTVT